MIGIPCRGEAHAARKKAMLDNIGYEMYMLLMMGRNLVADKIDRMPCVNHGSREKWFIDEVDEICCSKLLPGEGGDTVMVWVDIKYTEK
jgi:hypothetical protein